MKKIALTMLSFCLLLSLGISVNLEEASAQNTSAIGIADVLGNISGEVKQGFEIK
jgi:hypothetical protein